MSVLIGHRRGSQSGAQVDPKSDHNPGRTYTKLQFQRPNVPGPVPRSAIPPFSSLRSAGGLGSLVDTIEAWLDNISIQEPAVVVAISERACDLVGHVPVLDDEDGLVKLVADLLTDAGLTIRTCNNPFAALDIVAADTFDAIVGDSKMPGMNGAELYASLAEVAPEMVDRIAFATGDAMSQDVLEFFRQSQRPYIEKPILKDELLGAVAKVLPGEGEP